MDCVICGKSFSASRSDARCCSSNCRHKLRRERQKLNAVTASKSWQLEDSKRLREVIKVSPGVAPVLDDFRFYFGRDVAVIVLQVCERIISDLSKSDRAQISQ